MTCKEKLNFRDLEFSHWIREKLPSSDTGLMVSDLDFILQNYKTKKIMLVEVKKFGANPKEWQKSLFTFLHNIFLVGVPLLSCSTKYRNWSYLGFHLITFKGSKLSEGLLLDKNEISEQDLIKFLSI
jgi:hypothetical protein